MADLGYNYKTNYANGYTFTPYLGSEAAGANDIYRFNQNKDGGINYFRNDAPVTNTEFGQATGADYNSIEGKGPNVGSSGYYFRTVAPDYSGDTLGDTLGATSTTDAQAQSDTLASLADQRSQLQGLLGRTEVGLSQGLTRNQDDYNTEVGGANNAKALQYGNFADKRLSNNENKQSAYGTINRNANAGYRSLAQIIGRASGTGSSAFRDLLPNVIGQDTSSKRRAANENFGRNLQGIDKAQRQYDISFESVLADLLKQRDDNESSLRTGVEGQRQGINSQLAQNAAQDAEARGGGFAAVKAASQPFQDSINSSRDTVQSFFDQFRTPFAQKQAVAPTPELSQYTTDRSVVNQQAQGGGDASNPYAQLLRKRLQQA